MSKTCDVLVLGHIGVLNRIEAHVKRMADAVDRMEETLVARLDDFVDGTSYTKRAADAAERTSEQLAALIEMIDSGDAAPPALTVPGVQPVPMATVDDTVRLFIAKRCCIDEAAKVTGGELFRAYRDWSIGMGLPSLTSTAFGRVLSHLGIGRIKSNGVIVRTGLSIRSSRDDQGRFSGDSP